jgi:hypothetical protein
MKFKIIIALLAILLFFVIDTKITVIERKDSGDLSLKYKGIILGTKLLKFNEYGRCYIAEDVRKIERERLNAKIEENSTVPACFKDFYDNALLPICGHPLFDLAKYCYTALFYENEDYNKFKKVNNFE